MDIVLVRFKAFGTIRQHLGKKIVEVDVPEGSSVFDVIRIVVKLGDSSLHKIVMEQERISGNLIVLLNKRDVSTLGGLDISVNEGDEIALLPHVQGG